MLAAEPYRGCGIGIKLVWARMEVAREQGYKRICATMVAARGILVRLGWQPMALVLADDDHGLLYQFEF